MWKIEIFPNENNPDVLDMQVLSTAEDMVLASEIASWINWNDLAKTFVVMSRTLPRDAAGSNELLCHRFERQPMPAYEDIVAEDAAEAEKFEAELFGGAHRRG